MNFHKVAERSWPYLRRGQRRKRAKHDQKTAIPEATPKLIYEVQGGDHNVCNTPSSVSGAVGRYGLSWQKVFLEGDERYRKFLTQAAPQASDFRSNL